MAETLSVTLRRAGLDAALSTVASEDELVLRLSGPGVSASAKFDWMEVVEALIFTHPHLFGDLEQPDGQQAADALRTMGFFVWDPDEDSFNLFYGMVLADLDPEPEPDGALASGEPFGLGLHIGYEIDLDVTPEGLAVRLTGPEVEAEGGVLDWWAVAGGVIFANPHLFGTLHEPLHRAFPELLDELGFLVWYGDERAFELVDQDGAWEDEDDTEEAEGDPGDEGDGDDDDEAAPFFPYRRSPRWATDDEGGEEA